MTEEEIKLAARRVALENQEEQLAAHLEERRQKLLQLIERAQAERTALEKERAAYEQLTGDMTQAQRDILLEQQKNEGERKRLKNLQRRLRQRWHRFWLASRLKLQRRSKRRRRAGADA